MATSTSHAESKRYTSQNSRMQGVLRKKIDGSIPGGITQARGEVAAVEAGGFLSSIPVIGYGESKPSPAQAHKTIAPGHTASTYTRPTKPRPNSPRVGHPLLYQKQYSACGGCDLLLIAYSVNHMERKRTRFRVRKSKGSATRIPATIRVEQARACIACIETK